jgi:hypothetical protein
LIKYRNSSIPGAQHSSLDLRVPSFPLSKNKGLTPALWLWPWSCLTTDNSFLYSVTHQPHANPMPSFGIGACLLCINKYTYYISTHTRTYICVHDVYCVKAIWIHTYTQFYGNIVV